MSVTRSGALAVGYLAVFVATALTCLGWLVGGAAVVLAVYLPPFTAALAGQAALGHDWARAALASAMHSEPLRQAIPDFGFSMLDLVIAGVLLARRRGDWVGRLLALAMVGSAGAFNLQSHAAASVVQLLTGWDIGELHQVLLHDVACSAFVAAMLIYPAGRWETRRGPHLNRLTVSRRIGLAAVGAVALVVLVVTTVVLPHTVSCVLIFGLIVPLSGMAVLPHRMRYSSIALERSQARLAFTALLATFATISALAVVTVGVVGLGGVGMTLHDPTAQALGFSAEPPIALLFWFSRLAAAGIVVVMLIGQRRGRLWVVERRCARSLAALIVVVLVGGGYQVVQAAAQRLSAGALSTVLATVLASVYLLPAYRWAEGMVDRVLYGRRPTPYRVLADVAALSGGTQHEGPNLAMAAEAIGQGLRARFCRLTVLRPGLRDRTYTWTADPGVVESGSIESGLIESGEADVVLPIRQGSEQIGAIAVDHGAVAGLGTDRRGLLEDIAESLAAIVAASRLGIELERQLRAAAAHAEDIAVSRRQAVAEMDHERRTIERDLHDGAQHHLVSLRLTLGAAEYELEQGRPERALKRLAQLDTQLDGVEQVLAETASGVTSMVLVRDGLVAALRTELADPDTPVIVTVHGLDQPAVLRRIGEQTATAVYFCCLESVNNARRHAAGAPVSVRVELVGDRLRFTVRDEGPGFEQDPGHRPVGRGHRNLAARIASVGGQLTIRSVPGAGTTVCGWIPTPNISAAESALEQVRALIQAGRQSYPAGGPGAERLDELCARLSGASPEDPALLRGVLDALEQLASQAPTGPPAFWAQVEQARLRMHELAETELADALRTGTVVFRKPDRLLAERLLGARGRSPAARLDLPGQPGEPDQPDHEAIRQAAAHQLSHWRHLAAHPATTRPIRDACQVLTRICESLLTPNP